jgi:hypothetical protein
MDKVRKPIKTTCFVWPSLPLTAEDPEKSVIARSLDYMFLYKFNSHWENAQMWRICKYTIIQRSNAAKNLWEISWQTREDPNEARVYKNKLADRVYRIKQRQQNCSVRIVTGQSKTEYLTPCSRVRLEKLVVPQLFKTFSAFYRSRRFLAMVTTAWHWSLPQNNAVRTHLPSIPRSPLRTQTPAMGPAWAKPRPK